MMHYSQSQLKKQGPNRLHPGTPRPNLEGFPSIQPELEQVNKRKQTSNTKVSPALSKPLPKFLIWVKNEPFDFGILSPLPCPKIGINILRKIADYCREKSGHYPNLSLNQWSHICKYKIQLTNADLCIAYFRVFDILYRPPSSWAGQRDIKSKTNLTRESTSDIPYDPDCEDATAPNIAMESRDVKFYKILNQGHDANEEFKVDTLQFLLFLYIQHFHRLHKKFSMRGQASGDEPWPKHSKYSGNNPVGTSSIIPEQQHAEFLVANLEDMIDFLMILYEEHDLKDVKKQRESNPVLDHDDDYIAVAVIRALSLIIGSASISHDREFRWLDECLSLPEIAQTLNYNKANFTVSKRQLVNWLISNLKVNPWGPSSVPLPQVPVSLMTGMCMGGDCNKKVDGESQGAEIFKKNKIFWNTQKYPKAWFLVSNVEKQTLLLDSLKPFSSIKINRCIDSNIYLPGVHNMILIQKCHALNINIGVAAKVVKVMDCTNITLSGVGRLFIICDSVSSTFHLLTPSSPLVCGNKNHKIQLAPYNTSYPTLGSHMKMAGISANIQKWNKPLELSSDGFPYDHVEHESNVSILRPNQFKMTTFPFKLNEDGATGESESPSLPPGLLSGSYQRRLTFMADRVSKVKTEFTSCHSRENMDLLYKITLDRFKKWLKETGNYEQIVGLLSLQKSLEQDASTPVLFSTRQDLACVSKYLRKFFNFRDNGNRSSRLLFEPRLLRVSNHEINSQEYNGGGESFSVGENQKERESDIAVSYKKNAFNSTESMSMKE